MYYMFTVESERQLVLLGQTGVGKSASGNTILGREEFRSKLSVTAVTRECSAAHATVSDRSLTVVDTPGLFDTRSTHLSSPGPHAFLIVFTVRRLTCEVQQILQMIEMMFGQEVLKYSIILFTYGDYLKGMPIEEIIKKDRAVRDLVDQCGGGYHIFNNRDKRNREQVTDLLEKIDTMIEKNGGYYSNQMLEEAQRRREDTAPKSVSGKSV
ncbi:GTPase IMAP family member 9-like [Carassius gibelio]|uniref:GTPase IMAP family member 9-like n=1 Tax=Carassius gibelio TaxID=101364 RepID=UPI002277FCAC|nr:GTPase IMAP family member 9-like [Carassius gibelio]